MDCYPTQIEFIVPLIFHANRLCRYRIRLRLQLNNTYASMTLLSRITACHLVVVHETIVNEL